MTTGSNGSGVKVRRVTANNPKERSEGILLRPTGPPQEKLSWEETAREMAASHEDWSAWDATANDGLDDLPALRP